MTSKRDLSFLCQIFVRLHQHLSAATSTATGASNETNNSCTLRIDRNLLRHRTVSLRQHASFLSLSMSHRSRCILPCLASQECQSSR